MTVKIFIKDNAVFAKEDDYLGNFLFSILEQDNNTLFVLINACSFVLSSRLSDEESKELSDTVNLWVSSKKKLIIG